MSPLTTCSEPALVVTQTMGPDAFDIQRSLINRLNPVIFDVGAHVGEIALRYRRLFPDAVIHAFEPFPEKFEELQSKTAGDANLKIHRLTVCDANGSSQLHCNTFSPTNSLLESDEQGARFWGEGLLDTTRLITTQTTSLDSFCENNSIHHVDILKLDIQGAEYLALEGAKALFEAKRISLVYMEVIIAPTYRGQRKLHDYFQFMDNADYVLFNFYNPINSGDRLIQADLLFASRELIEAQEQRK